MNCCTPITSDTGRLFTWFVIPQRLRFQLFGFEKTQRQLIDAIKHAGLKGSEVLEIGCGTGYLHQALLKAGAIHARGVDLSAGMLTEARRAANETGLQTRTDYRLGDFVQLADDIPDADITILDKVVCCYPDWEPLLDRSLTKTRRIYALTFPRDRRLTQVGSRLLQWGMGLINCCYQPYIHDPESIQQHILGHGFQQSHQSITTSWYTQVYVRIE